MRQLVCALAAAIAVRAAQPYATNQDGSVLHFSSSLRLKGTAQYFHPKIFVWEQGSGVRLYEQRANDEPAIALFQGFVGSQYFQLQAVNSSSDGGTVALLGERVCTAVGCGDMERYQTTIYSGAGAPMILPGSPVISRNGRYVLLSSSVTGDSTAPLVDLSTGLRTTYYAWPYAASIANDGTVPDGQVTNLPIGGYGTINATGTALL